MLFPGNVGPGFWRGIRNDDAYKAVVRAYNDWLAEEYCSHAPERLIGIGVIPITTIEDAVGELNHCKKIGLKAVAIDNFPAGYRYPTLGDDGFWAAAVDLEMALTIHVEFGFPRRGRGQPAAAAVPSFKYARQPDAEHHVPDVIERFNKYGFRGSKQVVQMIWGGAFERFPKLKIYVARGANRLGSELDGSNGTRVWPSAIWGRTRAGPAAFEPDANGYAREHGTGGLTGIPLRAYRRQR